MAFDKWWEEEEGLRELREAGPPTRTPADALDGLEREETPTPAATPTPTAPDESMFDLDRGPQMATPEPRRVEKRSRDMTPDEQFARTADPLQMMRKVARDQGFEDYAVPYLAATKDIAEKQDFAGMWALREGAVTGNDDKLGAAVGKHLPFSVPFDWLHKEEKDLVSIIMNPENEH